MKLVLVGSLFLALAGLVGCGSANDPSVGQSADPLSATSSATAAKPPIAADPICPKNEKICRVEEKNGSCRDVCVKDTALCVAPKVCEPIVCDPSGPAPHAGCSWDEKKCVWDCPVCDPVGSPPRAGCSWDLTTCTWECPVCDPPPPPETGCSWDEKACVWLCL
jgi:hypothetical protein